MHKYVWVYGIRKLEVITRFGKYENLKVWELNSLDVKNVDNARIEQMILLQRLYLVWQNVEQNLIIIYIFHSNAYWEDLQSLPLKDNGQLRPINTNLANEGFEIFRQSKWPNI